MPLPRLVPAALLLAGCAGPPAAATCRLPALSAAEQLTRGLDDVPVVTLPDSGGILANGAPVPPARLVEYVRDVLAPRPSPTKVLFVAPVSTRRCADLRALVAATEAAGGTAYDAAGSHRLLPPPRELPP